MKPFFTMFFLIVALNILQAQADEITNSHCKLDDIAKYQKDLSVAISTKQLNKAVTDTSMFFNDCRAAVFPTITSPKNQINDFYNLVNDLLSTQLKTGKIHDCIKLGSAATEAWDSPYKSIKDSPIYLAIKNTIESCKNNREKEIANKFSAEKCPLFGSNHKYSSAIAVPKNWKVTEGNACLYLYGGKNRDKPEEEGIAHRENYPHLILLTMDGEDVYEKYIDFNQGELASKAVCLSGRIEGVDFLAASGTAKNSLIRIKSYAEHCLRDSTSFEIDSVYKIDKEKGLIPINELLITLHP